MATLEELDAAIKKITDGIASVKGLVDAAKSKVDIEIKNMESAFSRFLAKLAAGTQDFQAEVDAINAGLSNLQGISGSLQDMSTKLDSASAEANVEGV